MYPYKHQNHNENLTTIIKSIRESWKSENKFRNPFENNENHETNKIQMQIDNHENHTTLYEFTKVLKIIEILIIIIIINILKINEI